VIACACLVASPAAAQSFTSRGFADARLFLYPQTAPNDATRVVGEALLRCEPSWKPESWLRVNGSFDARIDTHGQVERRWFIDWQDRGIQRPPFSVRRLSALLSGGGLNIEVGKQFIRWGKTDVLSPTDRFAPRDLLSVVDYDFLGVTGGRVTYEARGNTLDAVWIPRFTPSRIPLLAQRWTALPPIARRVQTVDAGSRFPGGSQTGLRWNRSGAGYEFSLSIYNGFNSLPLIEVVRRPDNAAGSAGILPPQLIRVYPQMRMYGGDVALPNRWLTLKGEIGYFTSSTAAANQYGIYVVQFERQVRDWVFVGGYAGDFVTRTGVAFTGLNVVPFEADRGLARAFLGRASLSLGVNDSLALQAAIRRNGHGTWLQAQYSRAWGGHLRATIEGNVIRGAGDDFLGQFHRNSNANLALRYSF